MSSHPNKPRKEHDFYPTPDPLARAIVDRLEKLDVLSMAQHWLEPSAGEGAFVRALQGKRKTVEAIEPFLESVPHAQKTTLEEYCKNDHYLGGVLMNPPFSLAREHLELLIPRATVVVCLLRVGFLGSFRRLPFWEKYPPSGMIVIAPRPSFTGKGSDSSEYAFFVWGADVGISHLNWKSYK